MINTGGTALVGAAYWAVAAHLYARQALGRGSALVAALYLVSSFAQLNLANTLPRFLPRAGRRAGRLIVYSYGASSLAALAGGVLFVLVMPRLSSHWDFLGNSAILMGTFVVATVVWGVFALQDAVLLSVRRPALVPVENAAYGVLKLALLVAAAAALPVLGIFVSWVIPLAVVVPAINWLIFRQYLKFRDSANDVATVRPREVLRFASLDYVGAMFGQAYGYLLPLLVLTALGPAANSNFYIAWSIALGLDLVTSNFATSLLVEGAAAPHRLRELTRGMLIRSTAVTGAGVAALVVGGPFILRIYGPEYARHAWLVLDLLGAGCLPLGFVSIAVSLDRVSSKVGKAVATRAVLAILVLGGSWLMLSRLGIEGVGLAWLGAHFVVAVVRAPGVVGTLRRRPAPGVARSSASRRSMAAPADPGISGSSQRGAHRRPPAGRHRAASRQSATAGSRLSPQPTLAQRSDSGLLPLEPMLRSPTHLTRWQVERRRLVRPGHGRRPDG